MDIEIQVLLMIWLPLKKIYKKKCGLLRESYWNETKKCHLIIKYLNQVYFNYLLVKL